MNPTTPSGASGLSANQPRLRVVKPAKDGLSSRRWLPRVATYDRAAPTLGAMQLWKPKFAARDFGSATPRKVA